MRVLPDVFSGSKGEIDTLVLLDDGSMFTLLDADLARSFGLSGPEGCIRMQGVVKW